MWSQLFKWPSHTGKNVFKVYYVLHKEVERILRGS